MDKIILPSQIQGTIKAPASKSYAQRAIAAALLAKGESILTGMGLCDDTEAAIETAQALGAEISTERSEDDLTKTTTGDSESVLDSTAINTAIYTISNTLKSEIFTIKGGFAPCEVRLNVGESGLAARLFTPIATLSDREITVSGKGSILSRPFAAMQTPMEELGARFSSENGLMPLTVQGKIKGGETTIDGSIGSQFVSGLLMTLPLAEQNSILHVQNLKSRPYIDMTIELLKEFGVTVENQSYETFKIAGNQHYIPTKYNVEGDWSSASCLLVAGAIAGEVTVENLNLRSLQADRRIIDALMEANAGITLGWDSITTRKGRLKGFIFDAMDCPDLFPALVALASNCDGESKIVGTERLIHKESNRAETLASEFGKLGIIVDISECNIMRIERGDAPYEKVEIDSHNDHRIAMAAAVAALTRGCKTVIRGAETVAKSYPEFWDVMGKMQISEK